MWHTKCIYHMHLVYSRAPYIFVCTPPCHGWRHGFKLPFMKFMPNTSSVNVSLWSGNAMTLPCIGACIMAVLCKHRFGNFTRAWPSATSSLPLQVPDLSDESETPSESDPSEEPEKTGGGLSLPSPCGRVSIPIAARANLKRKADSSSESSSSSLSYDAELALFGSSSSASDWHAGWCQLFGITLNCIRIFTYSKFMLYLLLNNTNALVCAPPHIALAWVC
jgi:hypothetical protein